MSGSDGSTPHAQPFYCPYCGENDFVPFGDEAGSFCCYSCERHFMLRFVGLATSVRARSGGRD